MARRTVAEESWPISGAALRRARRSHRPASTLGPPHIHVQRARPEAAVADQLRDAGRHAVQRERVDNGHHHPRAAAGRAFGRALGWHPAAEAEEALQRAEGLEEGETRSGPSGVDSPALGVDTPPHASRSARRAAQRARRRRSTRARRAARSAGREGARLLEGRPPPDRFAERGESRRREAKRESAPLGRAYRFQPPGLIRTPKVGSSVHKARGRTPSCSRRLAIVCFYGPRQQSYKSLRWRWLNKPYCRKQEGVQTRGDHRLRRARRRGGRYYLPSGGRRRPGAESELREGVEDVECRAL